MNVLVKTLVIGASLLVSLEACSKNDSDERDEPVLSQIKVSELVTADGKTYVNVEGKPFAFMGAQIRLDAFLNCDKKKVSELEPYFQKAAELGLNCMQIPVSWNMVEPKQDQYDFSVVDYVLEYCNKYNLRMELLWFSTNMIGDSFSYLVPTYILATPRLRLWRNDEGTFWNYYGYQYALILDDSWLLERETKAVKRLFDHIRYWDSKHGDRHPVISAQIHNEPDGFVRWRIDQKKYRFKDGTTLTKERAWEMTCNALDAVGQAVQNSSYKVVTRTNLVKGNGISPFDEAVCASPKDIFDLKGIDFISVDIYRNDVDEVRDEVEAYASISGNYALVGENKGSYSYSPSLILTAFAAGGGYDIYDLATSRFFIDNTNDSEGIDHGVYTYDLMPTVITEPTKKIVKGIVLASEDIAVASPADIAAFNVDENVPARNRTQTLSTSSLTIDFSTAEGAIGFVVDRSSYAIVYSTENAKFAIQKAGVSSRQIDAVGGVMYKIEFN